MGGCTAGRRTGDVLHDTVELDGAADRFVYDCARVTNISDKTDVGRRRTSLLYRVVFGEDVEHEGVVAEGYTVHTGRPSVYAGLPSQWFSLPGVDEFEGLVQRGNRDHSQDGAEYLPIFHNSQKKKPGRLAAQKPRHDHRKNALAHERVIARHVLHDRRLELQAPLVLPPVERDRPFRGLE